MSTFANVVAPVVKGDLRALSTILSPLDPVVFLRRDFGRHFLHIPGTLSKFDHLFSWPSLNSILNFHSLFGRLHLMRDGSAVPADILFRQRHSNNGTALPALIAPEMTSQLREGATLIVDAIDELHEPIRTLSERLEMILRVRVQVNMYASWRSSSAFGIHFDDHDVFVLQITGPKQWKIYQPTMKYPVAGSEPAQRDLIANEPVVWDGVLRAGEALYIPRGWWHVVTPCDEPTIHLTVGMTNPTGIRMLQWVLDEASQDQHLRMDIPRIHDSECEIEYIRLFKDRLVAILDRPGLVTDFLSRLDSVAESRPRFGLPSSATGEILPVDGMSVIEVIAPRGIALRHHQDNNTVSVAVAGKDLRFDDRTIPLFEYLTSYGTLTLQRFREHFSSDYKTSQIDEFLSDLVRQGVVVITEPL